MPEFNTLDERIQLISSARRELNKVIHKNNEVCYGQELSKGKQPIRLLVNKNTKQTISLLRKRLGLKDSLDAETWIGCFPLLISPIKNITVCAGDSIEIALKVMPITITDLKNKGNTKYRPWKEIYILEQSTEIVQTHGVPNLPLLYGFSICNSLKIDDYINKRLKERMERASPDEVFGKNALIIFNELADYDIEYWIKNVLFKLPDPKVLKSCIFQVMAGLAILNKQIHLVHFDLHVGNVLVSEINAGGFYHYRINNKDFYLPNYGYLFKVWDFSRSILLEGDTKDLIIKKTLFHGKRQFGDQFKRKTANVIFNIEEGSLGGFMDYLYSFDTFKFAKTLYTVTRIKQESESSRSSRTKQSKKRAMTKSNPELNKVLQTLVQITKAAQTDLIKKLTLSKHPSKFTYNGTPAIILSKFFPEYKKKPDSSLIINKKPVII